MRTALAALLLGCSSAPIVGMDAAVDGSIELDAGPGDGGPRWAQMGCRLTDNVPVEGVDRLCPSVHEWERLVIHQCVDGAWYVYRDAGRIDCDAGDGGECRSRTEYEACSQWVRCPNAGGTVDCFHCLDFGNDPTAAPIALPFDAGACR